MDLVMVVIGACAASFVAGVVCHAIVLSDVHKGVAEVSKILADIRAEAVKAASKI